MNGKSTSIEPLLDMRRIYIWGLITLVTVLFRRYRNTWLEHPGLIVLVFLWTTMCHGATLLGRDACFRYTIEILTCLPGCHSVCLSTLRSPQMQFSL